MKIKERDTNVKPIQLQLLKEENDLALDIHVAKQAWWDTSKT